MAWRARAHFLTRQPRFVLSWVLGLLASGLVLAMVVVQLHPDRRVTGTERIQQLIDQASGGLRRDYQDLMEGTTADPRSMARWLRRATYQLEAEKQAGLDRWADFDLDALLDRHSRTPRERGLFSDYLAASMNHREGPGAEALDRLETASLETPPPEMANQLRAQLLVRLEESRLAMECFVREGRAFPSAQSARTEALHWAVELQDVALTKNLLKLPGWTEGSDQAVLYHAGALTGNIWLQWTSLFWLRLDQMPVLSLGLALMAIGLWYVILVQHRPGSPAWRWASPVLPLIAGVASIWPTLSIAAYQDLHLGMSAEAPFPHNLWYYFGGVALREELCKLALFVPFLPWLLKRGDSGLALLTGAFVGLGFALEENLDYYDPQGGGVVWSRLITANFLHAALSGLAAKALFDVIQSRFTRVAEFSAMLVGVIALHGLYDLVLDRAAIELGADFFAIILLAVMANQFFSALASTGMTPQQVISPAAVFAIGSAALVAVLFVAAAWIQGSMSAVSQVGQECVGMVPVGVLYWRRLAD